MALTTNVARDPEWDLKPRTWHKEPGRNPGRVSHERGTKNPGRNPGRISHERGTENQKGTPEESATNVAQRTRKEPRKSSHERGTENQKGTLEESATTAAQGSRKGILEESRPDRRRLVNASEDRRA
jgi:hypothetical protein